MGEGVEVLNREWGENLPPKLAIEGEDASNGANKRRKREKKDQKVHLRTRGAK